MEHLAGKRTGEISVGKLFADFGLDKLNGHFRSPDAPLVFEDAERWETAIQFTIDLIADLIDNRREHYDVCVSIGPMIMMKFVCKLTKELGIPTIVSLNPIMVDGTGMCGACRVTVGGKVKFACVDGPEFDGHQVNFDEAMQRQQIYKTAEGRAFLKAKEAPP